MNETIKKLCYPFNEKAVIETINQLIDAVDRREEPEGVKESLEKVKVDGITLMINDYYDNCVRLREKETQTLSEKIVRLIESMD